MTNKETWQERFDKKYSNVLSQIENKPDRVLVGILLGDIRQLISQELERQKREIIELCIKSVPTKVVNGKLREEKWRYKMGQSEINAYNLHRKQTITNLKKLQIKE